MSTLVQRLVTFAGQSHFASLPPDVVSEAKRLILDSASCAVAALSVEKGKRALAVARAMAGPPEVTIIGTGEKRSAASAAFANGELINAIDFDSILTPPGHVTPYVLPAILGMAQTEKSSGKSLIAAVAVAHEVSIRLGMAMGYYRDFKPGEKISFPVISGFSSSIFGGTLGAAMLRGLDPDQTASALGLAGHLTPVQTLGKWGRTLPASDDKYQLAGWISQGELLAISMAENGYRGDVEVFESDFGFWRFVGASKWNPGVVGDGLGTNWRYPASTIYKPWPHCRGSNTALDCLQHLIELHDLKPEEMTAITAYWDSHTAPLPVYMSKKFDTAVGPQMSCAYGVSMVAHRVPCGPEWYHDETVTNRKYLDFMDKVTTLGHPAFEEALLKNPQSRIGKIEVVARGQTYVEERMFRKGSPATPETRMSDDDLARKFRHNAAGVIPAAAVDRIIATVLNLEELDDVSALTALW